MLEVRNLTKVYRPKRGVPVTALNNVSISIEDKGMVFILGKSGSGKSTFLNCLGGLDRFDGGEIIIKGKSSASFSQSDFDSYRNTYLGFIFQEYNILNEFSVGKNIMLAMELQGKKATPEELDDLMERVDLKGYANRRPTELSGGQKQRVAIARALIKEPDIIMADEPTGALDSNTGRQVFETLKKLSKDKLVLIVSHDREYAEYYGDRVIEFADGKIISDITKYKAESQKFNGLNIIDNRIIHIKKGYQLVPQDLNIINECINSGREDTIISVDQRSNREFKRIARIDEEGNKESFKDTTAEDVRKKSSGQKQFELIKSRFSLGNAIKIGASGLKAKPIRLFFTILLCVTAFVMFGLADTLGAYNKTTATVNSIRDSNINYVSIVKQEEEDEGNYSFFQNLNMNDKDIEMLSKKFNQEFAGVISIYNNYIQDFNFKTPNNIGGNSWTSYYKRSFSGFLGADKNKLANLGYQIVAGEYPKEADEIAVSIYTYEHFKTAGWGDPVSQESKKSIDITNYQDLISKTIQIDNKLYIVTGIVDTKLDSARYESLKSSSEKSGDIGNYLLANEFSELISSGPHALAFISEKAANEILSNKIVDARGGNGYEIDYRFINDYTHERFFGFESFRSVDALDALDAYNFDKPYYFFDGRTGPLKNDEILLPFNAVQSFFNNEKFAKLPDYNLNFHWNTDPSVIQTEISNLNLDMGSLEININNYSKGSNQSIQVQKKIAGWFYGALNEEDSRNFYAAYLTSAALDELRFDSNPYSFAISFMPSSNNVLKKIVEFNYEDTKISYRLSNSVMAMMNQVNSFIEGFAKVFLYVGIGFAVFSALMLMNFIATSISYKKREIGILRAIGAKSSNVFSIFFSESTIIALINWFLAAIGAFLVVILLNNTLRNRFGIQLTILNFSIRQIALILGVSLVTAFISSFLPVNKIARKKPIDAIQNR